MKVIKEISAMQDIAEYYRRTGLKIGLVPTMGSLHEGHVSLIIRARDECDIVIASIFVNPSQFLPGEDYNNYPRDFMRDFYICKSSGVDYIFYPGDHEIYPNGYATYSIVEGLSDKLEGGFRQGHFRGVATIVTKLFNITKPHYAYFGQKDAQQAVIIKRIKEDFNFDLNVIICETIRDENGLALSSRNAYLSGDERKEAAVLYAGLKEGKRIIEEEHKKNALEVQESIRKYIEENSPHCSLQYIAVTDNKFLDRIDDLENYKGDILISLAAYYGGTRLIDNIIFTK